MEVCEDQKPLSKQEKQDRALQGETAADVLALLQLTGTEIGGTKQDAGESQCFVENAQSKCVKTNQGILCKCRTWDLPLGWATHEASPAVSTAFGTDVTQRRVHRFDDGDPSTPGDRKDPNTACNTLRATFNGGPS